MRKLILNKWFALAFLLTISLSAFSWIAYQGARSVCTSSGQCARKQVREAKNGGIILDALSGQFSSVSIH